MIVNLNNIDLRRGHHVLLRQANLQLHSGQRVGVTGANGTGKTSLLGMITGEFEADSGEISLARDLHISYLTQETRSSSRAALDYVLDGDSNLRELESELERAVQSADNNRIAALHEKLELAGAYDARSRAEKILQGLGFAEDEFQSKVKEFSGGWRIRLKLAQVLISPGDLLLLDEPTNHLDLDATIWLENWIRSYQGSLMLISHDRDFLDKAVQHIVHIENQELKLYRGNYSAFEEQRSEALSQQKSIFEKQQRRKKQVEVFVNRFRAKATKARQVQSRLKELERMELVAAAHVGSPFRFRINEADKLSNPLLTIRQAAVSYERMEVLKNLDFSIRPGDCIGVLGRNGAGKTTLIRTIAGQLSLAEGERIEGEHVGIAYFAQHQVDALDMDASPLLHLQRLSSKAGEQEIRNFLGGFNFHGDKVKEKTGVFSGGEKARLALAMITWQKPNLLLLDEPTNHLDIEMRQALVFALQEYSGAMLMISHDRHLLRNCVNTFWLVSEGSVQVFEGDLVDYQESLESGVQAQRTDTGKRESRVKRQEAAAMRAELSPVKKKLEKIETEIKTARTLLEEIELELSAPGIYSDDKKYELQSLLKEQGQIKQRMEEMEITWFNCQEEFDLLREKLAKVDGNG